VGYRLGIAKREDHEQSAVAQSMSYASTKVVLETATELRDRLRKENESSPRRCPEDLTEDWVYKAGAVAALNAVIGAPDEASEAITQRARREK